MLPDITNYIPDPNNGRPIASGQVYFFIDGYTPPTNINDVDLAYVAEVTAGGAVLPQPIYTTQGGVLRTGSLANMPQVNVSTLVRRVAVYDKCGALIYSTAYNGVGAFVDADELSATDSTVVIGGVEAGDLVRLASAGDDTNSGFVGLYNVSSSTMILGDSITQAVGASTYTNGYAYQVARSLCNFRDNKYQNDSGFGWHSEISQANAVNTGLTSNGSIVSDGLVLSRRSLADGQSVTITSRAYNAVYVHYDGGDSTGSLVFAKNGSTISTQAVSGSVLTSTAAVTNSFVESDTLTVTASGGTVVITSVLTLKTSSNGNLLYIAGRSGFAYQDYISSTALDEIAYYLNFLRAGNEKLLVLNLGTNNLYNSGASKTPAEMVALIDDLITGINSRCSSVKYVIAVPPKANESIFPIIKSGFEYSDYVLAITQYAADNTHGLIRHDKSVLSTSTDFYSDGVHPSNVGHRIMANTVCKVLGLPLNPYVRTTVPDVATDSQVEVPMNDTWAEFTGASNLKMRAHKNGRYVFLSGFVQPNGSVDKVIGTLPAGYRPANSTTLYLRTRTSTGQSNLQIYGDGRVEIDTIAPWVSLDNISFINSFL